jgi:transcriptional regulator with XRE-family HTH domain
MAKMKRRKRGKTGAKNGSARFFKIIDRALRGSVPTAEKINQSELAARLGCRQTTISNYRLGLTLPPQTRIPLYAQVLGLEAESLAAIIDHDASISDHLRAAEATVYLAGEARDELAGVAQ